MRKIQEPRGDDDPLDTDTDLKDGPVHDTKEEANTFDKNITNIIADNRQDKEVSDEIISYNVSVEAQTELETSTVNDTEEFSTNEPVERDISEPSIENVHKEKDTIFDNLNITGDYGYCDVLKEEQETVSINDIFWFKVKNAI